MLLLALVGVMLQLSLPPRSSWLLLLLLLTGFTGAVRSALRDLLLSLQNKPRHPLIRVAAYGAATSTESRFYRPRSFLIALGTRIRCCW